MKRCIAYHNVTGVRCLRPVGIRHQQLCLCATHGKSMLLCVYADSMPDARRQELARSLWTHASQVVTR